MPLIVDDAYARVVVPHAGDVSVLAFEPVVLSAPTPNADASSVGAIYPLVGTDVAVRCAYAGVNFIDTYFRSGLYAKPYPFCPGQEGAGCVVAYGPEVDEAFKERHPIGSKVAFFRCDSGSYAQLVKIQATDAFALPDSFDLKMAAAALLQGLTAHYLTHDTYAVRKGDTVLVHAAAGGTGLLVSQMAKHLGAGRVIGVCGGAEKAALAKSVGKCDDVVDYLATPDWEAEVLKITGSDRLQKCHVVYDGVGKSTFASSLKCLRPRGMMVSFGNASGAVDPVAPLALSSNGSLFLTRPTLWDYMIGEEERRARVASLVSLIESGAVSLTIGAVIPLAKAAEAHRLLEGRETTGKILLETC